ncbi:MAG: uroporphyrinogen-III synthase [Phycisphaerae bacterium]
MTATDRIKTYLQQIGPWPANTVSLMGIGPGDPGLLCVKALLRLADADVLLYDMGRQPSQLARLTKPDAVHLCVGRTDHRPRIQSADRVKLIKPHLDRGRRVAILKSGDPMVFNRGEQDARALAAAGIAFEIIPAPTAALAAAAYAGIPVTDRKRIDAVSLAIGKADPDPQMIPPDLPALTRSGTLAVYMAEDNIAGLVERLSRGGLEADTPLAVVENATRPTQRVIRTSLGRLIDTAKSADLHKPAIIFIGSAADACPDIRWLEARPLAGQRILVTRPAHQAASLVGQLAALGADVLEAPTLGIEPLSDSDPQYDAFMHALRALNTYDYLIVTSANAIDALRAHTHDVRALAGPRLAVIGTATLARFRELHLTPEIVPQEFTSQALARCLEQQGLKNRRCLLLRSDIADTRLPDALRGFGAEVDDVIAYRAVCPESLPQPALTALHAGHVDWATFTSPSAFKNFLTLLGPTATGVLPFLKLASLGPRTTATIRKAGYAVEVEAQNHTSAGLADAIAEQSGS